MYIDCYRGTVNPRTRAEVLQTHKSGAGGIRTQTHTHALTLHVHDQMNTMLSTYWLVTLLLDHQRTWDKQGC